MVQTLSAEWFDTLLRSLNGIEYSPLGEKLPHFPSNEMQIGTTGLSSEAALKQAFAFAQDVIVGAEEAGVTLGRETTALDFGFGWGRISRVFLDRFRLQNIHGLDVDPQFVELTRELFGSINFRACNPLPPSELSSEKFDLIYSYSVFSHLSEDASVAWMLEFERLLKPGGIVAFTTRHDGFFDYCAWAATQPKDVSYTSALGELFPDLNAVRREYQSGKFIHASSSGVDGGGPRNSSFYGETWIPESYVRTRFADKFRFVRSFFDGSRYDQVTYVLQRL